MPKQGMSGGPHTSELAPSPFPCSLSPTWLFGGGDLETFQCLGTGCVGAGPGGGLRSSCFNFCPVLRWCRMQRPRVSTCGQMSHVPGIDGAFTRCRAVTPGGMGQVGTGMLRVETDRTSLLSQLRKNTGKQVRGWHRHTGRASGGQERPGRGNDGIAPLGRGLMGLHWHFSRCGWQRVMAKVFC